MLSPDHVRKLVIRPALQAIGLWSVDAESMVLGTAIQESGLRALSQVPAGPARGLWQMERVTFGDLWGRFLDGHASLKPLVRNLAIDGIDPFEQMAGNMLLAAAMCRVKYFSVPAPLPPAGDIHAQAAYWKRWYNTPLGGGRPEQFVANVARALAA